MKLKINKTNSSRCKKLFVYIHIAFLVLIGGNSCSDYLDVVPDNVPTLDHAFANRREAERYLYTCYTGLPKVDAVSNILFMGTDDMWTWGYGESHYTYQSPWKIACGDQNVVDPLCNAWNGNNHLNNMFQGIRICNTFLENIENQNKVPGLNFQVRKRWIAEAKFLKAYYHFYLFRMYGPIPITDTNLPVSANRDEVAVKRNSVDEVVEYLSKLLTEAAIDLPLLIENEANEAGRITKGAALTLKAKLLVTAASPLFNGNPDFADYTDKEGKHLFCDATVRTEKWEKAVKACEAALDSLPGVSLYYFPKSGMLSERTQYKMNLRGAVTEKWNSELIWGRTGDQSNNPDMQKAALPGVYDTRIDNNLYGTSYWGVTFNMVDRFYSKNGVPIDEDKTWDYAGRYAIATAGSDQKYNVKEGYRTAKMNLDRENRFYASLTFDGALLYMDNTINKSDENSWLIEGLFGKRCGRQTQEYYCITGYNPTKLAYYKLSMNDKGCTTEVYPWPELRLADLYLLYAEALNEVGRGQEAIPYLDLIRERSGLKGIKESWSSYSRNPNKPNTQEGLREIIHQEREIELAFEGQRLWDLRRWKKAEIYQNKPILGWNIYGKTPEDYYKVTTLFQQEFKAPRDYLWPIKEYELLINKNLTQNPGW